MSHSDRTRDALLARTESLCNAIYDDRNTTDAWGGEGYLSTILRTVKPRDTSEHSTQPNLPEAKDYATSAMKELSVREAAAGLIKTTQDLSTLIRDLQEIWLFGGLDTLADPADEEVNRQKAIGVAEMVEVLAKGGQTVGEGKDNGVKEEEKEG